MKPACSLVSSLNGLFVCPRRQLSPSGVGVNWVTARRRPRRQRAANYIGRRVALHIGIRHKAKFNLNISAHVSWRGRLPSSCRAPSLCPTCTCAGDERRPARCTDPRLLCSSDSFHQWPSTAGVSPPPLSPSNGAALQVLPTALAGASAAANPSCCSQSQLL